jgi:hypothetical protein
LLGAILGKFINKVVTPPNKFGGVFDYVELPLAVTEHPEWPANQSAKRVVVVPRKRVVRVIHGYFSMYDLECADGDVYRIGLSILRRSRAMKYLAATGWNELIASDRSPSFVRQFAPFLGLLTGVVVAAAIGIALRLPAFQSGFTIEVLVSIGAFAGLVSGMAVRAATDPGRPGE